jgi:hypothetical protein
LLYFIFLALFFCSMITYSNLLLGEYAIPYFRYGYGLLEALVLAKVILLGQSLHLAERFAERSLWVPTLYKAIIFTLLAGIFTAAEHFVVGFFHGESMAKVYLKFLDSGIDIDLAKIQVIFLVFLLFFAFTETARVLGEHNLFDLFLRRNRKHQS